MRRGLGLIGRSQIRDVGFVMDGGDWVDGRVHCGRRGAFATDQYVPCYYI